MGTGLGPHYCSDRFLVVLREMQEREKALRLQKERLQRELEEKKKKVGCWEHGLPVGSVLSCEVRELENLGLVTWGNSVARGEGRHTCLVGWVPGRAAAPG